MTDEALEVLQAILGELQAINQKLGAREPAELRHDDRTALAKILPVLAANFEGRFGTWELVDAAAQPDALGANLRLVLGKMTAQQLGKLFQRAEGQDVDGLTLRRRGRDGSGTLWECTYIHSHSLARAANSD